MSEDELILWPNPSRTQSIRDVKSINLDFNGETQYVFIIYFTSIVAYEQQSFKKENIGVVRGDSTAGFRRASRMVQFHTLLNPDEASA